MASRPLNVWVVDDDQSVRWVLEKALRQADMKTRSFERAEHLLEAAEREIIDSLFTLADRPVRDVMTPRVDIVTLGNPISIMDVREAVTNAAHSRFPVSEGDLDDLAGLL